MRFCILVEYASASSSEKKLRVNNPASASDEKCYPLKALFRAGNNAKSDDAKSGEYGEEGDRKCLI